MAGGAVERAGEQGLRPGGQEDASARRETGHLLGLGPRWITCPQTTDDTGFARSSEDRLHGYLRAPAEVGVGRDETLLREVGGRQGHGMPKAAGRLLTPEHPPTAVSAETDDLAC